MQTPKSRVGTLEVPQRTSPGTAQSARQLKMNGSESDSPASMTSNRSPKVNIRRLSRSPVSEVQKKRPSRVPELESQLAQLQGDLKKAKDQLSSLESWKRRAQQEAEEAKKQLITTNMKLEESQRQLLELSSSDDERLQELRKISQERDRAWQSELEALQKQHSIDSAALVSAMNEIQRLKIQLDMFADSEASQSEHAETAHAELHSLKLQHAQTLSLVESLKAQLDDCKESEAQAEALVNETLRQLETAKIAAETLPFDSLKIMEANSSLISELEQSKAQVSSFEELVCKLKADLANSGGNKYEGYDLKFSHNIKQDGELEELNLLKEELSPLKLEVVRLRSALEIAEMKYKEEQVRSTMHIRSAYELVEERKSESTMREAELEATLKKAKADIDELKEKMMHRDIEFEGSSQENLNLPESAEKNMSRNMSTPRMSEFDIEMEKLKANLMDKETELQFISEENEILKSEIKSKDIERAKWSSEAAMESEAVKVAEREVLLKLDNLTEEADKSTKRAAWVAEQLDAAQATNTKLEAELRKLKVQSDQWRKAAEAAAAILSTEDNAKFVERSVSFDSNYDPSCGKMTSPYSLDMDDDSPKKNNSNMLKKLGVLWKKGPK